MITHTNVYDGVRYVHHEDRPDRDQKISINENPFGATKVMACAVWMKEDSDDQNTEYEYEYLIQKPSQEPSVISDGRFKFTHQFYRIEQGILFRPDKNTLSGVLFFENRIRAVGGKHWLSQRFPILIEITHDVSLKSKQTENAEPNAG